MKKKEWLAWLGVLGACALCCVIPLLGGAAVLGISSFFLNPLVIGILALVLIIVAVVVYQRRKANGTSCMKPGFTVAGFIISPVYRKGSISVQECRWFYFGISLLLNSVRLEAGSCSLIVVRDFAAQEKIMDTSII